MLFLAIALAAVAGWLLSDVHASAGALLLGGLAMALGQAAMVFVGLTVLGMVVAYAVALLAGVAVRFAVHGPQGEWAEPRSR